MAKIRQLENQAAIQPSSSMPSGSPCKRAGEESDFSILLVDDSFVSLRGMLRVLKQDWETDIASGADEALYMVKRNGYSVVITDCDMPGRDGLWLLNQVQKFSPKTVRVLASGGLRERFSPDIQSGLIQCFLDKPVASAQLREMMQQLLLQQM